MNDTNQSLCAICGEHANEHPFSHHEFAAKIDVQAQIQKFGADALGHIDRLQGEKRDLLAALKIAASELEQYVDLQQKMDYLEYAASTQTKLDAVNAAIAKVTHVQ